MAGEIRFVPMSKKGNDKLISPDGYYSFNTEKVRAGLLVQFWRCSNYKCPGRFKYTPETGEGIMTAPHMADESKEGMIAKDEAMAKLKERVIAARGQSIIPIVMANQILREVIPEARQYMPTREAIMTSIRRWASKEGVIALRAKADDYPLLEDCQTDNHGEQNTVSETKPTANKSGDTAPGNDTPKGLIILRSFYKSQPTAMIDGKVYVLVKKLGGDREIYTCQEAENGCPVTAHVNRAENSYDIKGEHQHISKKKRIASKGWMAKVKLVGDDGEKVDPLLPFDNRETVARKSSRISHRLIANHTLMNNVYHESESYLENEVDDFLPDYDDEVPVPGPPLPPNKTSPDITKSGERCFVCGDELVVSEALSSNAATFQKACRYLNVRSEKEWFPGRVENSNYYSFCESCSTEITRIHELYKKIQEIQSLIFNKVETVEKRIADAEIVDNWMAEAPPSSAKRFEGFRNQVLINYRNKLKLRREIRMGRKMGNDFEEVQPVSSAHMFASDPAGTNAFSKVVPASTSENLPPGHIKDDSASRRVTRRSGRPKPKCMKRDTDHVNTVEPEPVPDDNFSGMEDVEFEGFEDSQEDAMSVHSEAELKFDPGACNADEEKGGVKENVEFIDEGESSDEEISDNGGEDPDWNREEDVSRGQQNKRSKQTVPEKSTEKTGETESPFMKIMQSVQGNKVVKPFEHNFPDVIMGKDGRMFMDGIEIIKNAPGAHKLHPERDSFTCSVCNKIISSFSKMQQHICGHHLGMYKCEICNKNFCDLKGLSDHVKTKHSVDSPKECPICGKPLKGGIRSMKGHMYLHLSEEEKQDPKYKSFRPPSFFRTQRAENYRGNRQTFMCSYCSKAFFSPAVLKRHELIHTGEKVFQCQLCGKIYQKYKTWHGHVSLCEKKHKGTQDLIVYPCPKCTVRFRSRTARNKHVRKFHRNTMPISCPKCPERFSTTIALDCHKRHCSNKVGPQEGSSGYSQSRISSEEVKAPQSSSLSSVGGGNRPGTGVVSDNANVPSSDLYAAAGFSGYNFNVL